MGFGNDEKRREELLSAFNHQYLTLIKFYQERKQAMSFILADAIGYLYARLEMGICFLKGRGVEKNITKFCEYMQSLALYIEDDENDYSNGRAEYYIAYMYFLLNDVNEGIKWIIKSKEDGYDNARKVANRTNVWSEMKRLESLEDAEYTESYYKL